MTISFTQEQLYLAIIVFFMVIQVWQWRAIYQLKGETAKLWSIVATIATEVGTKLDIIETQVNNKEDKK